MKETISKVKRQPSEWTGWISLQSYTKINSKWSKDLKVRPETIKLLEENIGKTFSDINHSRILYDPSPRILEIKAKNKQMGPN